MKFFFKDNSYSIFKMFINQVGMTIFGIALSLATTENDTLFLLSSIFSACFYMVLLYSMTWDIGTEEKIRIDAKRLKYNRFKGLYMSLIANIPNFIIAILALVGYYGGSSFKNGMPVSPNWAADVYGLGKLVASILEGMYSGIIYVVFNFNPWAYLLIIIPSLLTCFLAYMAGVKGFRIFPAPKNKQNKQ